MIQLEYIENTRFEVHKMEENNKEVDCCENCYVCGGCEHSLMDVV